METQRVDDGIVAQFFEVLCSFLQRFLFWILSVGPIPVHISFIMDGNRRYEKTRKLEPGMGHRAGIDNFKRRPEEVRILMELLQEKIESLLKAESIVHQYGIRVHFIGNLNLLDDSVRAAAEKAMLATASNNQAVLCVCIAYTSTDEIAHASTEASRNIYTEIQSRVTDAADDDDDLVKSGPQTQEHPAINSEDITKNMYMAVAPEPDIVLRSSGETRLSNFLLWQTSNSILYSPGALWPEVGLKHLVWAVLNFQRNYSYLQKIRKQT
uniref:Alkyl transferase n=1 Tax=Kalanchoe fedtschenkoi TaxID=63787 RepID=A0A7N0UTG8_KALFE